MKDKISSIFISDCHLGSKTAQTEKLLAFMETINQEELDNLYIVGDFIDGWKLKKNWNWDDNCNLIISKIFNLLKHKTNVYWVAGNHDDFIRPFLTEINPLDLAGLKIENEFIHESISNGKLLVIHGDQFDSLIKLSVKMPYLVRICDMSYDYIITINNIINYLLKRFGFARWSFSQSIKGNFKNAMKYISNFEMALSSYALEKKCSGVMCGHIHSACISKINDVSYFNCGDWVESNTAIIEYKSGKMEIFRFDDLTGANL